MLDVPMRAAALVLTLGSVLAGAGVLPADAATKNTMCRSEAQLGKTNRDIATLTRRENRLRDDQTDFVLVNGHPNPAIDADLRRLVGDLRRLRSERTALQKEISRQRDTAVADLRVDYAACETAAN